MLSKMSDTGRQQVGKVRMSFNWSERVNNLSEVFYKTVQASVKLERASQHSVQMKSLTIDCISFSRLYLDRSQSLFDFVPQEKGLIWRPLATPLGLEKYGRINFLLKK